VVEHLPSKYEALGSVLSERERERETENERQKENEINKAKEKIQPNHSLKAGNVEGKG
jgi:hypothetical protein